MLFGTDGLDQTLWGTRDNHFEGDNIIGAPQGILCGYMQYGVRFHALNPAMHCTQFPKDGMLPCISATYKHPRSVSAAPKVPRHVNKGGVYPPNAKM